MSAVVGWRGCPRPAAVLGPGNQPREARWPRGLRRSLAAKPQFIKGYRAVSWSRHVTLHAPYLNFSIRNMNNSTYLV